MNSNLLIKPDHIIYLRVTAEECLRRLKSRNRSEESGVSLEYLARLNSYYDNWLLTRDNVSIVNAHQCQECVYNDCVAILEKLSGAPLMGTNQTDVRTISIPDKHSDVDTN